MNRILPMLITGFAAAVLSVVPILKAFSFCLILPFAVVIALLLDQKANKNFEKIGFQKAIKFGFITGFFATFFFVSFDLIMTLITKTNDFVESLPQSEILINQMNLGDFAEEPLKIMHSISNEIRLNGFSPLYTFMIFISNLIINSIFGIIGGLIGMGIINKRLGNIE